MPRLNWHPHNPKQPHCIRWLYRSRQPYQSSKPRIMRVMCSPPQSTAQQTATLLPGLMWTVNTGLASTCVNTDITSTITSSHHPTPELINSVTVPIGYHVNQTIKQKIPTGKFVNLGTLLVTDPSHAYTCTTSTLTTDAQGIIIFQPKPTTTITSTEKETDVFLIFFSMCTAVHPLK